MVSFFSNSIPLQDSKPVLLVNHCQPEFFKLDIFLNQGVSSDNELRFATLDIFIMALPFISLERAGYQAEFDAQFFTIGQDI